MSSKREAERDFLFQKYFVSMVFIVIGAMMVVWTNDKGIPYALFLIDSETVSGTVTGLDYKGMDPILSFNFSDQNGDEHSKSEIVGRYSPLTMKVGDTINVTIFPLYPEISRVTPFVPSLKSEFWIMIVGSTFIILAAVTSVFSFLQLIKHSKEDRYY